MKLIACLLFSLMSLNASADCLVKMNEPHHTTWQMNFIGKKTLAKVKRILVGKGYRIATQENLEEREADYSLELLGVSGIGCGTGLSWADYLMTPGQYSVSLSVVGGNEIFKREGDYVAVTLTEGKVGRRKLMKAVRSIPRCSL